MSIINKKITNVPIAQFETNIAAPLASLTLPLSPVQSFNGYDGPWPGGAGKNKLEVTLTERTVNGVTFTKNADGTISATGTATANAGADVSSSTPPPGTYILNGNTEGASSSTYRMRYRIDGGRWVYRNSTDDSADITLDGSQTFELVIDVISGQTVSGVLWKPMLRLATETDPTFEPYENICPISGWTGANVTVSPTTTGGTVYPVTWSEAGTVYGGEVDIVSGVLTVDRAIIDLGERTWGLWASATDQFICEPISGMAQKAYNSDLSKFVATNIAKKPQSASWSGMGNWHFGIYQNRIVVLADTTLSDFKTKMSGQKMVYELAAPQTYQLTPTQVLTLLGENNVWSDTGNITLEYPFRVFDIIRVKINGTDITDYIAFQGLKRGRNDVESPNAGRTLDAVMHRGRVATKLRWDVTCRPLTSQELSILENLIMPETVNVTIEGDPYYDTWTRRCYANNTSASYLILKPDGRQLWGGITFPIIEV